MMKQTTATEERSFTHEDISRRAREIWQARGQPSGQDDEIWFEAERTLVEESRRSAAAPARPAATEPPKRAESVGAAAETAGMAAATPKPSSPKKRAGKGGR